ncbi:HTH-type transcriptional regulator Lrp [Halorientalis litorea]|jgi:DNA-binding Lrp family transcriptional regulator|uniref:HTH-type transcriptional regulator Lrp n=1 Tax=Halorientalis litorea TaxID=2931977 RepID=UPI001FF31B61|nr:HTH-type transcriptional regulator Lrp [Halorientalis litorea]
MDIDDTDRRIVNALLDDGRASARDIAAETGVAATTVSKRLDELEASGVVAGYTATVDYEELGYDITAIFHLGVDGDGLASVVERLRGHDRMVGVYEVTGSHDIVAVGKFTDTDEMNAEIKTLLTDEHVKAANTSVVLNTVREFETFAVDTEDEEN